MRYNDLLYRRQSYGYREAGADVKHQPENVASAATAWANGQTAARLGVYQTALLWLERACRLAPNDPRIWLDLANAKLALNSAPQRRESIEILNKLSATHDHAPLELALLTAHQLQGDSTAAASALAKLLQRHCVPDDPAFADAAELITKAVGGAGWCGLLPSGHLKICAATGLRVIFLLDGNLADLTVSKDGYEAPKSGILSILAGGKELAGSPLDLRELQRVEGLVSVVDGMLIGWAHRPAAASVKPRLVITDAAGKTMDVDFGAAMTPDEASPFAQRWSFALPAAKLHDLSPPLHVTGPDGNGIMGSPLDPALFQPLHTVPASFTGAPVAKLPDRRALAIVVPVYRNSAVTKACLTALQAAKPQGAEVIVIDDATPEPMLSAWLDEQAANKNIRLIRQPRNLGFPAAANAGFKAADDRDVLLLNSDTLVPPGALEALADAAYAAPDIGSVTPFSNNATILSYPRRSATNAMPDLATVGTLQDAAQAANGADICEIPTAIGFCMYIRHDCLAATGPFRVELFGQGYGEENDWCLRARQLGYRHVAATGAYVGHEGGVSFKAASRALNIRNARTLARLYPGYDALISTHIQADPLATARHRLDIERFARNKAAAQGAVLLISHNHGGGVARIIAAEMQKIRDAGKRPLLLVPGAPDDPKATPFPWDAELTDAEPGDYPNLRFKFPADRDALLNLLRAESVGLVVFHHGLGHHPGVRDIAAELDVPQDIVIHDYASFCPRINLLSQSSLGAPLRYCGEPNISACVACVELSGDETYEQLGPVALVERSTREFMNARQIFAPSADAANRISRHFPGVRPVVTAWENDAARVRLQPPGKGRRRIVIIGGIGPAKGFDLLIDCARDAAQRQLDLEFVIAGASADDETLLRTSKIFVTGAYAEGEATKLIQSLNADLAFLPSIWPETWCFALSEAWRAGLYSIAFDLGAQAARLKATRRGALLPLGLPVPRINDILLNWQPHPGDPAAF